MAKIFENHELTSYNTFGIFAKAKLFATVCNFTDFESLLAQDLYKTHRKLILGGGSNIIFKNDFFDGLVLYNQIKGIEIISQNQQQVIIEVGGGENWHQLVLFTLQNDWQGLENLSLIPGSVGAAPIQNIGAYGVELQEVFYELEAWHLLTGRKRIFTKEECCFGYRDSIFKQALKNQYFIAKVRFCLPQNKALNIDYGDIKAALSAQNSKDIDARAVSKAVIDIRNSKLPNPQQVGNVGSFFKNPVIELAHFTRLQAQFSDLKFFSLNNLSQQYKIPAAWLIEQCGFKGFEMQEVGVSPQHALILINLGNATGKQVMQLSQQIQQAVLDKFAIVLEPEVNIVD